MVFSVIAKVSQINVRKTRNHKFKLVRIKYGDNILGDNVMETFDKVSNLLLDSFCHSIMTN